MLDIAITLLDKNRCVWLGLQRSTGGVAYDYILKPAADIAPKISSPPKEKPLTHNEIFEKLQKAEARRQVGSLKVLSVLYFLIHHLLLLSMLMCVFVSYELRFYFKLIMPRLGVVFWDFLTKTLWIMIIFSIQSLEAQKLEFVAKEKQRLQEALMKSQKEEEEKAKAAQIKLRRSMEITKENREQQIQSLQEKLREHVRCLY